MNPQLLTDALLDEERHAPDPGAVMTAVRMRIRRRRRRTQVSVLAALALVAALFSTTSQQVAEAPAWTAHIRLTWLPEGVPTDPFRSVGRHGELAEYGDQEAGPYLLAALDAPTDPDRDGWTETTIDGQRGRYRSSPVWTRVAWTLPSGRTATLEYGSVATRTPTLERDALRAAAALRDDGARVLRPAVDPEHVPEGLTLAGVDSDGGVALQSDGTTAISVTLADPSAGNGLASGTETQRVRDVQGHPAYLENNGRFLYLVDYHGHTLILFAAGQPYPSRDDLLQTADGLRWIGG